MTNTKLFLIATSLLMVMNGCINIGYTMESEDENNNQIDIVNNIQASNNNNDVVRKNRNYHAVMNDINNIASYYSKSINKNIDYSKEEINQNINALDKKVNYQMNKIYNKMFEGEEQNDEQFDTLNKNDAQLQKEIHERFDHMYLYKKYLKGIPDEITPESIAEKYKAYQSKPELRKLQKSIDSIYYNIIDYKLKSFTNDLRSKTEKYLFDNNNQNHISIDGDKIDENIKSALRIIKSNTKKLNDITKLLDQYEGNICTSQNRERTTEIMNNLRKINEYSAAYINITREYCRLCEGDIGNKEDKDIGGAFFLNEDYNNLINLINDYLSSINNWNNSIKYSIEENLPSIMDENNNILKMHWFNKCIDYVLGRTDANDISHVVRDVLCGNISDMRQYLINILENPAVVAIVHELSSDFCNNKINLEGSLKMLMDEYNPIKIRQNTPTKNLMKKSYNKYPKNFNSINNNNAVKKININKFLPNRTYTNRETGMQNNKFDEMSKQQLQMMKLEEEIKQEQNKANEFYRQRGLAKMGIDKNGNLAWKKGAGYERLNKQDWEKYKTMCNTIQQLRKQKQMLTENI